MGEMFSVRVLIVRHLNYKAHKILAEPRISRLKYFLFIAIPIAIVIGLLAGIEAWMNTYRPLPLELDDELGWTLKQDFHALFVMRSRNGEPYKVDFSTNAMGLRTHGSIDTAKIKMLVLGDSFTADPYAGDQQMWYSVAADKLEHETGYKDGEIFVWAGGAGGYGTYQNVLLLGRLLKSIRPDVFILQFCSNDFSANDRELEGLSILRSQKYRRPYADMNGNRVLSEDFFSPIWRAPVIGESRIFSYLDGLVQQAQYKYLKGYGSKSASESRLRKKYESESIKITANLLRTMRNEVSGIPAYMVNCSSSHKGPNQYWMDIAAGAGFIPLAGPPESVSAGVSSGEILNYLDGMHLNVKGNQVFGEAVAEQLRTQRPFVTPP
jgi:lysophospholipase L1-like esterase